MVRLRVQNFDKDLYLKTHFNSNMVRLRGVISFNSKNEESDFNSNMVRLRADLVTSLTAAEIAFQFQYGAIKR